MKIVQNIIKHRFVSATFWVFIATAIVNIGNYGYHFLMIILIHSPEVFGELESAVALLYIFFVPLATVSLVIVKFISAANGKGNKNSVGVLYHYFNRVLIRGGVILAIIIAISSPIISTFLHFSSPAVVIFIAMTVMAYLLSVITRSVIQGMTTFYYLTIINFVEVFAKIAFSILFIFLGYKALGGLAGFAAAGIISYAAGYVLLRNAGVQRTPGVVDGRPFVKFAIPVFFTTLAITSFITSDIIIVRHFFPGAESGYYSFVSLLGKIIYFGSVPISIVMFPLVSEHHARGERYSHYLFFSIAIMVAIILPLIAVYFLFPAFIINFFPNKNYLSTASLLGPVSIFYGLYSVNALLSHFYLSISKILPTIFGCAAALLQIILLWLYHESLEQMIWVSVAASSILFFTLLVYYPYAHRRRET